MASKFCSYNRCQYGGYIGICTSIVANGMGGGGAFESVGSSSRLKKFDLSPPENLS